MPLFQNYSRGNPKRIYQFRVDSELINTISELAEAEGISTSRWIVEALEVAVLKRSGGGR